MNPITLLVAGGAAVALLVAARLFTGLLHICPPNMVVIFSGRQHQLPDGKTRGFRVLFGGRGWRVPVLESAQWMSLTVIEIPIVIRNAYSKGGIPLNIEAIANVKVASDPGVIGNAIERFLGRSNEIARVAKETLEGHLRGVLSTLTPEEVNQDRLKFADSLARESEDDFRKLGLELDTLKVQSVSDDVSYLNSLGREAIANVVRDAEVAENDARREAAQVESECSGRASVIESRVDAAVVKMENELRRFKAEAEAKVWAEEQRTKAAAEQARAEAEQELQRLRVQLQEIQLTADQVLPAEAARKSREHEARGAAAAIRERGQAAGESLDLQHQAWAEAGDAALRISLIEQLEPLLAAAAAAARKVDVQKLRVIDGGDGQALAGYLSAYPTMIRTMFEAVAMTTGIDIPATVAGRGGPESPPGPPPLAIEEKES